MASAGRWYHRPQPHMMESIKVEPWRRERAQWPRGQDPQASGQFPAGGMRGLTAFVLLQSKLFGVWREHTMMPEEVAAIFPLSSQMS